jgi:hypothetical protein
MLISYKKTTNKRRKIITQHIFHSNRHQLLKTLSYSAFNSWWYCSIKLGFHPLSSHHNFSHYIYTTNLHMQDQALALHAFAYSYSSFLHRPNFFLQWLFCLNFIQWGKLQRKFMARDHTYVHKIMILKLFLSYYYFHDLLWYCYRKSEII